MHKEMPTPQSDQDVLEQLHHMANQAQEKSKPDPRTTGEWLPGVLGFPKDWAPKSRQYRAMERRLERNNPKPRRPLSAKERAKRKAKRKAQREARKANRGR